jgi:hypothetical protein
MLALGFALALPAGAGAAERPARVIVAVLPATTTVEQIALAPGMSPGLVSSGIGEVPAAQTYLDISQGNRINESLYDGDLPDLRVVGGRVDPSVWREVVDRADDAPADLIPGLLGATLVANGVGVSASPDAGRAQLIAVDRGGAIPEGTPSAVRVVASTLDGLRPLAESLRGQDLLIAISAPDGSGDLLAAGIAGAGFNGELTSDSTRTDGLVLSTDLAPTILARLGVDVPDEMVGSEIRAEGSPDASDVAELRDRLEDRPSRDLTVLFPLAAWAALAALVALATKGRRARPALRLLALAIGWAPFVLLVTAALDAGEAATALAAGLGSPALAAASDRLFGGYLALALTCGVAVGAYALDVIAGSPYSSLSVLGPNPGYGVRFFGIGNELEAILTTLTLIGSGAWLATRPGLERRDAAVWFLVLAALAAVAFAPGRFGVDMRAAIVLGVGAATAASLSLGLSVGRTVAAVVAAGVLALLALVAVDEVFGGAHLTRSVLGAGESSQVADVFERRLDLMAHTFTHPVYPELLVIAALALIAGFVRSATILGWFGPRWPARHAYVGAVVGVLVGTLANDSGSVLLVIGTIYLAAVAGFAWAARDNGG